MFTRRATITGLAIAALASSLAVVGLSAGETAAIAQPASGISLTSGPAFPEQPWDPNCWGPNGWNPACGPYPGQWGPDMMGPGMMGPGQWGPGQWGPGMMGPGPWGDWW